MCSPYSKAGCFSATFPHWLCQAASSNGGPAAQIMKAVNKAIFRMILLQQFSQQKLLQLKGKGVGVSK